MITVPFPNLKIDADLALGQGERDGVEVTRPAFEHGTSDLQQNQKSTNIQANSESHPRVAVCRLFVGRSRFHAVKLGSGGRPIKVLMQQDYYSTLAGIVMASARNNAQLRRAIYELARSKLRQQLQGDAKELAHSEKARQLLALETAIEQIEADLAQGDLGNTYSGANVLGTNTQPLIEIIPPGRRLPPLSDTRYEFAAVQTPRPRFSMIRSALMLVAAAMLGGLAYVVIQRGLHEAPQSKLAFDGNISRDRIRSSSSSPVQNIPQPSAYGVYALTNGKLSELQPLPIRVPDQQIAISALVSFPSSTQLPDGRAQFADLEL